MVLEVKQKTQCLVVTAHGPLSPRIKRPGRESDHSPPTSAEVMNERNCTSTSQCLHGVVLKVHGQLYFTLLYWYHMLLLTEARVLSVTVCLYIHTTLTCVSSQEKVRACVRKPIQFGLNFMYSTAITDHDKLNLTAISASLT